MLYRKQMTLKELAPQRPCYVTITGTNHYYDQTPFRVDGLIRCSKEPSNRHDGEAIRCHLPMLGTVGYIANSTYTVAGGTMSAGRLYDRVGERFYVRVMFITQSAIIGRVETADRQRLDKELKQQQEADDEWGG